MPIAVTDYNIVLIFNNFEIGKVSRVDFTAIGKKPGFVEEPTEPTDLNTNFKAAFIHIDEFYSSQLAEDVKTALETGECYKLQVSEKSFWMLLKATTPVKETKMNIHQIVDNCRYLEGIVEAQQKQIEAQQKQIDNMDNCIRQIVAGIYCHQTQRGTIDNFMDILDGEEFTYNDRGEITKQYKKSTHKYGFCPTTRQGDEHQKLIEAQQKQIDELINVTERVKSEVYQLFGGLYNQSTQAGTLNFHLEMLGINTDGRYKEPNTSEWDIWPTTRQGDKLEERMDAVEKQLASATLEKKVKDIDLCVRQIIGGIYCQRTQNGIIQNNMDVLDGKKFVYDMNGIAITNYPEPTHKHGYYPTTRQGDKLEARVEKLEQMLMPKSARIVVIEEPNIDTKIDVSSLASGGDKFSEREYKNSGLNIDEYLKKFTNLVRAENSSTLCGNE